MTDQTAHTTFRAERFKTFVDAVVAIAMTLLILPLLDSVSDAGDSNMNTAQFLQDHTGQLFSFVLSFVLIASFWMDHHRLYERVSGITIPLLWINVAWLLTIVWLPVPTAMLGQMEADPLQALLYIGTLILAQITTLAGRLYLARHRELTDTSVESLRRDAAGDLATSILFAVAFVIAAWVHPAGYSALLLAFLTDPLQRLLLRIRHDAPAPDRA